MCNFLNVTPDQARLITLIKIDITAKTSKMWIRLFGLLPLKKNPNTQPIMAITAIR